MIMRREGGRVEQYLTQSNLEGYDDISLTFLVL